MRRTISLLLSFAMIFVLAACGRSVSTERQEEMQSASKKTEESSESVSASAGEQEEDVGTRTLVVYFSCTGTTKLIAEYVTKILGADVYEIIPENPYTEADLAYYTRSCGPRTG